MNLVRARLPHNFSLSRDAQGHALALACILLFSIVCFCVHPSGFIGGGYDDARYVRAASHWLHSFPYLGVNHWELRHPFNLLLALAFAIFGMSQETATATGYGIILVLVIVTYFAVQKFFDRLTAIFCCLLLISIPFLAQGDVSIEPLELLFVASSFWAFFLAVESRKPFWLLAASGLLVGLAWEVRETSGALILLYGISCAVSPLMPRTRYAIIALFAAVPVFCEELFYALKSGDLLYRFHVDSNHIHVSSSHLVGKTSAAGFPLFNFQIARSWLPTNDFLHVNWVVDPYLSLFLSPDVGLVMLLSLFGIYAWTRSKPRMMSSVLGLMLLGGIIWFLIVVYALVLRPNPRYFGFTIYGAALFSAVGLSYLVQHRHRVLAAGILVAMILSNFFLVDLLEDDDAAYAIVRYMRTHQTALYVPHDELDQINLDLRDPSLLDRVRSSPAGGGQELLYHPQGEPCPQAAVWCSSSSQSTVSIVLDEAGLAKHVPHALWRRLARKGPSAEVVDLANSDGGVRGP